MPDNLYRHSALSNDHLCSGAAALGNSGFGAPGALTQAVQHDGYAQMSMPGGGHQGRGVHVTTTMTTTTITRNANGHSQSSAVAPATVASVPSVPFPKPKPTLIRERKNAPKSDDLEPYRAEIEQRVRSGETSRSIADDLASRGVNTNEQALVHRRYKWGLRVRLPRGSNGDGTTPGRRNRYLPPENDKAWTSTVQTKGKDWEKHVREAVDRVGIDPASADISETYQRSPFYVSRSANNPPPDASQHPNKEKRASCVRRSVLLYFKDEIIERTKRGESCEEIAVALRAKGVKTTNRSVGSQRLIWGLRQRSVRKDTVFPTLDVAGKRVQRTPRAESASDRATQPGGRATQKGLLRRLEVARMTREGMTAEQIAENLAARGVVWKGGATTVRRLQSTWGLSAVDDPHRVHNLNERTKRAVRIEQEAAFKDIAKELGIENVEEWVVAKLKERQAREARARLVRERMGPDYAILLEERKAKKPRPRKPKKSQNQQQQQQQQQQEETIDVSDDESSSSEDESSSEEETPPPPRTLRSGVVDTARRQAAKQAVSSSESDSDSDSGSEFQDDQEQAKSARQSWDDHLAAVRASAREAVNDSPAFEDTMDVDGHDETADEQTDDDGDDDDDDDEEEDEAANVTTAIFARIGKALPKATGPAPKPVPFLPRRSKPTGRPAAKTGPKKAVAASPSQASPPVEDDDAMGWMDAGFEVPSSHGSTPEPHSTVPVETAEPPSTQAAAQPAEPSIPALVVQPEETEANKSTLTAMEQYAAAAATLKDMMQARTENRPVAGSLTGLPPSLKDVEAARQRAKAAAHAMYTAL